MLGINIEELYDVVKHICFNTIQHEMSVHQYQLASHHSTGEVKRSKVTKATYFLVQYMPTGVNFGLLLGL